LRSATLGDLAVEEVASGAARGAEGGMMAVSAELKENVKERIAQQIETKPIKSLSNNQS